MAESSIKSQYSVSLLIYWIKCTVDESVVVSVFSKKYGISYFISSLYCLTVDLMAVWKQPKDNQN